MEQKSPLWTKQFIGIVLIHMVLFLGWQVQISSMPVYIRSLSGSDEIVGIGAVLSTIAALLVRPSAGFFLDRYRKPRVLMAGVILMMGSLLLYQIFPFTGAVLGIRFIAGLGWGIASTASSTIATEIIPRDRFAEGIGYFSLSQSVSLAFSPLIGLTIMEATSFYTLMWVAVLFLSPVIAGASFFRLKHNPGNGPRQLLPFEKSALRPALVTLLMATAIGAVFSFAVLYGKGQNFQHVGLFFSFFATTLFIIRPVMGRVIDRFGLSAAVLPGLAGMILSMLLLAAVRSEAAFLGAALLQGAAYGMVQMSLQTMSVIHAAPERRGAANATYFTGFDAGSGLGNLAAGLLAGAFGYSSMFALMAVPIAAGLAFFLISGKIRRPG